MATIRSTVQMTEGELKAWPTLGSLPTMADEHMDRSLTIESLPSISSSESDEETMTKVNTGRSTSSSPSAPAIRAAPGLEDLVTPEAADSATRYDRCLLLQVRLQLSSLEQDKEPTTMVNSQMFTLPALTIAKCTCLRTLTRSMRMAT